MNLHLIQRIRMILFSVFGILVIAITGCSVPIPESDPICLKHRATLATMRSIGTALGAYQVDYNIFPTFLIETDFNEQTLPEVYYREKTSDAWGTPFRYWSDGMGYTLKSYGKDAATGGADPFAADIVYRDGIFITPKTPQDCPTIYDDVHWKQTVTEMEVIATALRNYQVDFDKLPEAPIETTLNEDILKAPYYAGPYKDAWGTPFRYVTKSNGYFFVLTSYGQEKRQGYGTDPRDRDIIYDSSLGGFIAPPELIP